MLDMSLNTVGPNPAFREPARQAALTGQSFLQSAKL